jgi:tRNA/tmRNA/rRNA uracil-C5-methylase (TrmA/RlmC/RlmD family)
MATGTDANSQLVLCTNFFPKLNTKFYILLGINAATKEPCVGFRLGSYSSGDCSIYPADDCIHISDNAKKCAKIFHQFVVNTSFKPYDPVSRSGQLKTLTVRETRSNQIMITLDVNPTGISEEDMAKFKEEYKEFFISGAGQELNVTSLNFKELQNQ